MANYNEKKRNLWGILGWFAASLVLNLLALIPMVWREKKQAKEGGFALEWDDILRYGFAIFVGSGLQGLFLQWFFGL